MKTVLKILALLAVGSLALLLLAQLVPYGRDHTNPPVLAEPAWDSPRTRTLFIQTCGDCHSNETVWPWYTNIAPISWMTQNHVDEGREKFNVSAWGYQEENEAEEAVELYQHGEMPPRSYLPAHPEARLNAADRQALIDGLFATFGAELREAEGDDDD
jgi:mono/diheme cytochrome c family protein